MEDKNKTEKQLKNELAELRRKIAELEGSETLHRQTEEKLRESEAYYRNIIETARDIIFSFSLDGKIISLNPAFETITGLSRPECLGKNFEPLIQSLVHPDDSSNVMELHQRILNGETLPQSLELRILSKSGEYIPMEISLTQLTQNGKVSGLGIAHDITKR